MDWRFTFFLLAVAIAIVFGWQMALFLPPDDYRIPGWALAGASVVLCLVSAAGRGGQG
jgi:hypothetical protein